jgi:hypothetical protein
MTLFFLLYYIFLLYKLNFKRLPLQKLFCVITMKLYLNLKKPLKSSDNGTISLRSVFPIHYRSSLIGLKIQLKALLLHCVIRSMLECHLYIT